MSKIAIPKIRPASWKVYVQGKPEALYVSHVLREAGIDVNGPEPESGLSDPALYAMVATPKGDVTFTAEELAAILEQDDKLQLKLELKVESS